RHTRSKRDWSSDVCSSDLAGQVRRVGVFRPIMRAGEDEDTVLNLLLDHDAIDLEYDECVGVTYDDVHTDPDGALGEIIRRYRHKIGRASCRERGRVSVGS